MTPREYARSIEFVAMLLMSQMLLVNNTRSGSDISNSTTSIPIRTLARPLNLLRFGTCLPQPMSSTVSFGLSQLRIVCSNIRKG